MHRTRLPHPPQASVGLALSHYSVNLNQEERGLVGPRVHRLSDSLPSLPPSILLYQGWLPLPTLLPTWMLEGHCRLPAIKLSPPLPTTPNPTPSLLVVSSLSLRAANSSLEALSQLPVPPSPEGSRQHRAEHSGTQGCFFELAHSHLRQSLSPTFPSPSAELEAPEKGLSVLLSPTLPPLPPCIPEVFNWILKAGRGGVHSAGGARHSQGRDGAGCERRG